MKTLPVLRLFLTSSLCSLERRFQFLENQKNIILAYLPKIRKRKNCQFLIKTLNPLEKSQFFDLLNLLFLQSKKASYLSFKKDKTSFKNIVKHLFLTFLSAITKLQNSQFLTTTRDKHFLKKYQFFDFFNCLFFLVYKGAFTSYNIVKHIFLPYFQ